MPKVFRQFVCLSLSLKSYAQRCLCEPDCRADLDLSSEQEEEADEICENEDEEIRNIHIHVSLGGVVALLQAFGGYYGKHLSDNMEGFDEMVDIPVAQVISTNAMRGQPQARPVQELVRSDPPPSGPAVPRYGGGAGSHQDPGSTHYPRMS